jgi:hypothetical protein
MSMETSVWGGIGVIAMRLTGRVCKVVSVVEVAGVVEVAEAVEVAKGVEVAEEIGVGILPWYFRVPKANVFKTSYQQSSMLTPSLHQRNLNTSNQLFDKLL